jgi:hypothetical protein
VNITNLNHYKYEKYAMVVGQTIRLNIHNDNYIHTTNKTDFGKEYVKAYMKLLSK